MIHRSIHVHGAIPYIVLGIALFLSACQPKVTMRRDGQLDADAGLFAQAEEERRAGRLENALESYHDYLRSSPQGSRAPEALYRVGEIELERDRYENALQFFRRLESAHPNYEKMALVQYLIMECLYRLGEYRASLTVGEGWLDSYKGETLEGEVLLLIGRDYRALGDYPESFYWWLRAKEFYRSDVERRKTLHDRLVGIINTSQLEDLERLTAYAFGSEYEPRIYYALANLYLERNDLEAATEAAMRLVRSTPEQYWVSLGRELLERIDEEMSVKPHVVGCLLPLSGSFAIYGEEVLNGIELGIGIFDESEENLNLELVIKDTAGQPEETEVALQELVKDEKAIAVIGPLASKSALMAAERAQESGIPLIALTQREGITEEGDMVFRNFATPSQEVSRVLGAAMNDFGIERFAILYPDNSYGRFLMNLFWDQLEELGGSVTAVESYSPDATDFADQIKKMIGLFYERPLSVQQALEEMRSPEELESVLEPTEPEPIIDFDAVFIPDNFQRIAMIAPQLAFHDVVDVLLMGTSLWQSPKLIELAKDYVQGAIFPSRFFDGNPDPVVQNFIGEYRNSFDTEPGILAASGYDTIRLVKDVVAGQAIQTRRDFRDALLSFYGIEGVTGWLSFEMNGEPASEPFLMTISGGQMVLLP